MAITTAAYEAKKARLIEELQQSRAAGVRLGKETSNLFRDRKDTSHQRLNVRDFNNVITVDPQSGIAEVEGMTPYATLVDACLARGVMPTVVPELKSITIGGAVTGVAIESSSFKYGLVHETIAEMEVLLADGSVVTCTPDNEHSDLFFGFPNSYGTLGYALKLKVRVVPVKSYVQLTHLRFSDSRAFFEALEHWCSQDVDFVDGTLFSKQEFYITVGKFTDDAPFVSDYTYKNIYYRSIREKKTDYLSVRDYIWRWDTDWFWCSKNLYAQNPLIRRILGRERLNSITYTKIMRWNSRWKLTHLLNRLSGVKTESVIQDVEIPLPNCAEFVDFYFDNIRFTPVWACPLKTFNGQVNFDLYPMKANQLYVNFGFWDVIRDRKQHPDGYYNRMVERKVRELGGMKSLYSDSYFTEDEFWEIYNRPAYERLKDRYDSNRRFKDLYAKCVLKE